MHTRIIGSLLIIFAYFTECLSEHSFDPNKIFIAKGTSYIEESRGRREYLHNVYYDKELEFQILERYVPSFNDLIIRAKNQGVDLKCKKLYESIKNKEQFDNFYVPYNKPNFITLEPKDLELEKNGLVNFKYYLAIKDQQKIKIPKKVYVKLLLLKESIQPPQLIQVDLNMLDDPAKLIHCGVTAIYPPCETSTDNNCSICLDKTKEIVLLPCNHLTTCSDCSSKIDKCPICRKDIEGKIKVYY